MATLLHSDLTFKLRGIGFRVYNALGPGLPEKDYDQAVAIALESERLEFHSQPLFRVDYKDWQVGEYRPDYTFGNHAVVVDLKVTEKIAPLHKAQVLSYLRVTNAELGLIMNFGASSMEFERLPNFMASRRPHPIRPVAPDGVLYPEVTNMLIDALLEVHVTLGPGFIHQVYRRATRRELSLRMINFEYIKELPTYFENRPIGVRETRLFLIEQRVLVATVALESISKAHIDKLYWVMRQLNCRLGLIANFHSTKLAIQFARLK